MTLNDFMAVIGYAGVAVLVSFGVDILMIQATKSTPGTPTSPRRRLAGFGLMAVAVILQCMGVLYLLDKIGG